MAGTAQNHLFGDLLDGRGQVHVQLADGCLGPTGSLSEEDSPYMLLVAPVREDKRLPLDAEEKQFKGIDKLNLSRSQVPAITHVDYSARIQTVDAERHGRYHKLLRAFEQETGCPLIINTSFNVRGEPIVCSPQQAYRCFMATNMDVLVLENFVLLKDDQPQGNGRDLENYLAQFDLD